MTQDSYQARELLARDVKALTRKVSSLMRDHGPVLRERGALLKEVARLSALADDFNSERLGLKALLREQGQELADWARHWAWVTAQWGRRQAYLWWALGYKEPPRSRDGGWGGGQ